MNRYDTIPTKKNDNNQTVYQSTLLPDIKPSVNDIYIMTTPGDRMDILAYKYYGNVSYWWIIAQANPNANLDKGSVALQGGLQLRIPTNPMDIIAQLQNNNI